ncbi:MAG: phosphodiester glycosidase family protein [Bryobacteraceae bacterium]
MVKRFLFFIALALHAETPFAGVTYSSHPDRAAHVIVIDLAQPGLRFRVTPPSGSRETVRQTTLDYLREQRAQIAINAHFFEPFPSEDREAFLIGSAASDGKAYSDFETPRQSYAIVANAPVLNIDATNHAEIVHHGEDARLFNAIAGSAQIVTAGVKTIPVYGDTGLTPGGPNNYSNADSWYERRAARTIAGLTRDRTKLVLLVIDRATVAEAADFLIANYAVWDALNLDGGGSTTMAIEDRITHDFRVLNAAEGRAVGSNLAVFAPANVKLN